MISKDYKLIILNYKKYSDGFDISNILNNILNNL